MDTSSISKEPARKVLVCSICYAESPTENSFVSHLNLKHKKDLYYWCRWCGSVFSDRSLYVKHVAGEDCTRTYLFNHRCGFGDCNFSTGNPTRFISHLAQNHKGNPFIPCSYCRRSFTIPACLVEHIQEECCERPPRGSYKPNGNDDASDDESTVQKSSYTARNDRDTKKISSTLQTHVAKSTTNKLTIVNATAIISGTTKPTIVKATAATSKTAKTPIVNKSKTPKPKGSTSSVPDDSAAVDKNSSQQINEKETETDLSDSDPDDPTYKPSSSLSKKKQLIHIKKDKKLHKNVKFSEEPATSSNKSEDDSAIHCKYWTRLHFCDDCGSVFPSEEALKKHSDSEQCTKKMKHKHRCGFSGCKLRTRNPKRFLGHLIKVHKGQASMPCASCNVSFAEPELLLEHMHSKHKRDESPEIVSFVVTSKGNELPHTTDEGKDKSVAPEVVTNQSESSVVQPKETETSSEKVAIPVISDSQSDDGQWDVFDSVIDDSPPASPEPLKEKTDSTTIAQAPTEVIHKNQSASSDLPPITVIIDNVKKNTDKVLFPISVQSSKKSVDSFPVSNADCAFGAHQGLSILGGIGDSVPEIHEDEHILPTNLTELSEIEANSITLGDTSRSSSILPTLQTKDLSNVSKSTTLDPQSRKISPCQNKLLGTGTKPPESNVCSQNSAKLSSFSSETTVNKDLNSVLISSETSLSKSNPNLVSKTCEPSVNKNIVLPVNVPSNVCSLEKETRDKTTTPESLKAKPQSLLIKDWKEWTSVFSSLKSKEMLSQFQMGTKLHHHFKCMSKKCSFTTQNGSEFSKHNIVSHAGEVLQCVYCFASFKETDPLMRHIYQQHDQLKFQCSMCLYRSCSKDHVHHHYRRAHDGQDAEIITCLALTLASPVIQPTVELHKSYNCSWKNCTFRTLFVQDFERHWSMQHPSSNFFNCCYCQYGVNVLATLMDHYRTHNIYSFECDYCSFGVENLDNVIDHICLNHANYKLKWLSRKMVSSESLTTSSCKPPLADCVSSTTSNSEKLTPSVLNQNMVPVKKEVVEDSASSLLTSNTNSSEPIPEEGRESDLRDVDYFDVSDLRSVIEDVNEQLKSDSISSAKKSREVLAVETPDQDQVICENTETVHNNSTHPPTLPVNNVLESQKQTTEKSESATHKSTEDPEVLREKNDGLNVQKERGHRRVKRDKGYTFLCLYCSVQHNSRQSAEEHAQKVHKVTDLYKCTICSFVSQDTRSLKYHAKSSHSGVNASYCMTAFKREKITKSDKTPLETDTSADVNPERLTPSNTLHDNSNETAERVKITKLNVPVVQPTKPGLNEEVLLQTIDNFSLSSDRSMVVSSNNKNLTLSKTLLDNSDETAKRVKIPKLKELDVNSEQSLKTEKTVPVVQPAKPPELNKEKLLQSKDNFSPSSDCTMAVSSNNKNLPAKHVRILKIDGSLEQSEKKKPVVQPAETPGLNKEELLQSTSNFPPSSDCSMAVLSNNKSSPVKCVKTPNSKELDANLETERNMPVVQPAKPPELNKEKLLQSTDNFSASSDCSMAVSSNNQSSPAKYVKTPNLKELDADLEAERNMPVVQPAKPPGLNNEELLHSTDNFSVSRTRKTSPAKEPQSPASDACIFKYTCRFCTFVTSETNNMVTHLYKEMKYFKYRCVYCSFRGRLQIQVLNHCKKTHTDKPKEFKVKRNRKLEKWVEDYISNQEQKSANKNVSQDNTRSLKIPAESSPLDVKESYSTKAVTKVIITKDDAMCSDKNSVETDVNISADAKSKLPTLTKTSLHKSDETAKCSSTPKFTQLKEHLQQSLETDKNLVDVQLAKPPGMTTEELMNCSDILSDCSISVTSNSECSPAKEQSSPASDPCIFRYTCLFCNYVNSERSRMVTHLYMEMHYFKYLCVYCSFRGRFQIQVFNHCKEAHDGKPEDVKIKPNSKLETWVKDYLSAQEQKHAGAKILDPCTIDINVQGNFCNVCQQRFKSKGLLVEHLYGHLQYRPHYCVTCDKPFTTLDAVERHQIIEHQTKPKGSHYMPICVINDWVDHVVFQNEKFGSKVSHEGNLQPKKHSPVKEDVFENQRKSGDSEPKNPNMDINCAGASDTPGVVKKRRGRKRKVDLELQKVSEDEVNVSKKIKSLEFSENPCNLSFTSEIKAEKKHKVLLDSFVKEEDICSEKKYTVLKDDTECELGEAKTQHPPYKPKTIARKRLPKKAEGFSQAATSVDSCESVQNQRTASSTVPKTTARKSTTKYPKIKSTARKSCPSSCRPKTTYPSRYRCTPEKVDLSSLYIVTKPASSPTVVRLSVYYFKDVLQKQIQIKIKDCRRAIWSFT